MEHYYNFEFDAAETSARAIRDRDPDEPVGHFLLAEACWWQVINRPDLEDRLAVFEEAARETIRLGEAALERDKRDPLALFFLAGAHGRRAILAGLDGSHFEAVQASLTARKYLQRLRKYHPEYDDAYFGLGLYDYYAAQLPWFARVIGKVFLGLAGNRKRGIEELERAAERGLFTQVEARIFLAIVYLDEEQRYDEALAILRELNARYPDNLDYYGMLAFAYRTQDDHLNALRMLETLARRGADSPAFGARSRGLSRYFLGSTYKVAGQFVRALPELDRAVELASGGDTNWLLAIARLERGRVHDLLGTRSGAIADYEQVLELRDFRDSHASARAYLEAPYSVPAEEQAGHLGDAEVEAMLAALGADGQGATVDDAHAGQDSRPDTAADEHADARPESLVTPALDGSSAQRPD
jgi:tetratricopeptide (TPR) repeat protein